MSYEGTVTYLCRNGHISYFDAYEDPEDDFKCRHCGEGPHDRGWTDHTNIPSVQSFELELVNPAVTETCPTCEHIKTIEPETYKMIHLTIPKELEH